MSPLDEYYELRRSASRWSKDLFERYAEEVQCRRGCFFCCEDISVLPIEYEALRRALEEGGYPRPEQLGGPPQDEGHTPEERAARGSRDRTPYGTTANPYQQERRRRCAFLGREGECTVYAARPVICRTHGLPLAYRLYEYDETGAQVPGNSHIDAWCDLNFAHLSREHAGAYFDYHGRIDMAEVNDELDRLNRRFISSPDGEPYRRYHRGDRGEWIRLSELMRG